MNNLKPNLIQFTVLFYYVFKQLKVSCIFLFLMVLIYFGLTFKKYVND